MTPIERITLAAQLAVILEVSAYPKPGNISRLKPFQDTQLDHFLAGGIAIGPAIRKAALQGLKIGKRLANLEDAKLGFHIKSCIKNSRAWHGGGNTNFGTVMLLVPMATAAGLLEASGTLTPKMLGKTVKELVEASTVEDAQAFYEAVTLAGVGGLGKPPKGFPDASNPKASSLVAKQKLTLFQVLKACAANDLLCRELTQGLPITVCQGFPTLLEAYRKTGEVNKAIIQTYLQILSKYPDTLIARKSGLKDALKVSKLAGKVLKLGGVYTAEGWKALHEMERSLQTPDNRFNPGATADLTAAAIMLFLLMGYRP